MPIGIIIGSQNSAVPTDTIYGALRASIRDDRPCALVTVIEGPNTGAKLLVRPGSEPMGGLGDDDLDRVAGRDALGELGAGTNVVRHYGEHGFVTSPGGSRGY